MMCPAVSWWDAPGRLPAGKRNWDDDFSKGGNTEVVPLQRGEVPDDRRAGESWGAELRRHGLLLLHLTCDMIAD